MIIFSNTRFEYDFGKKISKAGNVKGHEYRGTFTKAAGI